jgi:hypothetical protein
MSVREALRLWFPGAPATELDFAVAHVEMPADVLRLDCFLAWPPMPPLALAMLQLVRPDLREVIEDAERHRPALDLPTYLDRPQNRKEHAS